MTKRIVSGVFILTALGALGVILAGALSSGEQLIVRFLTAVIVAALGLYVISDLRLQADEDLASAKRNNLSKATAAKTPMDSTAAFMATATQSSKAKMAKTFSFTEARNATSASSQSPSQTGTKPTRSGHEEPSPIESYFSGDMTVTATGDALQDQDLGAAPSSTTEQESAVVEGAGSPPSSSVNPPSEPVTVDIFAEQPAADEFAWPMPPSHPDSKSSETEVGAELPVTTELSAAAKVTTGDSQTSDNQTGDSQSRSEAARFDSPVSQPDGYRVELTESKPPAGAATKPWSRNTAVDRAVSAADYADAPLAPIIDLRGPAPIEPEVETAIKAGEVQVVATLIEQGMLSTSGPITDREVRTMVYVAFTSNELRKLLRAGRASNTSSADDLGPVELFDPLLHKPAPARLYSQSPAHLEDAQRQLG